MSKVALITGITGQDGSYLAEFLLEKGYEVHGIVRRASISNTARIDHLIEKNAITLHDGDLSDSSGLIRLVGEIKPDEIYNLAAQSHVQVSFDAPEYSGDVDALGVLRVLDHLELGNMDSLRDWGYAKDYVECMWLIMQQDKPEDFVIATGVQHTVRDFTEKAFAANGITIRWEGTGIDEKGYDAATGKMLVCVNPQWFRPTDVDNLWGDPTKAKTVLGWNPQSTTYEQLVEIMAKHDRERAKREKALKAVL